MKGRKPKPIAQRRREGNAGKRRLPAEIEIPVSAGLEVPEGLPPEAERLWREIVPPLEQAGILHPVDRAALQAMCVQWSVAEMARLVLKAEGHWALGSTGQLVPHPAVAVMGQAHDKFRSFAEQFGASAAARARIAATLTGGAGTEDPALGAIMSAPLEEL